MRKLTLLVTLVIAAAFAFGQFKMAEPKKCLGNDQYQTVSQPVNYKAGGDILWSEDFDATDWSASVDPETNFLISPDLMPAGWKVFDANGENFYWHWSQVGPRGRYTSMVAANPQSPTAAELLTSHNPSTDAVDLLASTTAANGVMMLESDYYNTTPSGAMVATPINMDSYIMTPVIDLSAAAGAHLVWQQRFRFCCSAVNSKLDVLVSTDYDEANPDAAHWTTFDARFGTLTNAYQTENPKVCRIDLSAIAAGFSNVRIKWQQTAASHYVWIIDDIQILEPFANDLVVKNQYADYLADAPTEDWDRDYPGGYYYVPKDLAGEFTGFRVAAQNMGINDQATVTANMKVFKNNIETTPLLDVTSPAKAIAKGITDTLKIVQTYQLPAAVGKYTFDFNVLLGTTDNNAADNHAVVNYRVSDDMYTRTPLHNTGMTGVSTGNWVGGDIEGAMLAAYYYLPTAATVKAVSFYFNASNDSVKVAAGDFYCIARVFAGNASDIAETTPVASTDQYTLQVSDMGTFVNIPLLDEGNLNLAAGSYYVAIEGYTTSPDGDSHVDFLIGRNITIPFPIFDNGWPTAALLDGDGSWGWVTSNLSIGLQIEADPTPMTDVVFNLNMQNAIDAEIFDPAADSVKIIASFNGMGEEVMYMSKVDDSHFTLTTSLPVGDVIQFKYAIETNTLELEETIGYREGTVAVGSIFSFNWDGNGVMDVNQLNSIKVYPNPANNVVNIANLVNVSKVEISNILGQVVYTNSTPAATISVNTSNLSNGVYFITISDNKNNTRTERFMKK